MPKEITMGDRANICIKDPTMNDPYAGVWLYAHWDGVHLRAVLQAALARKERWNDSSYLARIIFCEMVKKDVQGETGYGISTRRCDDEHPVLYVDTDKQTVALGHRKWSMNDYIKLDSTTLLEECDE
jgi:hypothetical protein